MGRALRTAASTGLRRWRPSTNSPTRSGRDRRFSLANYRNVRLEVMTRGASVFAPPAHLAAAADAPDLFVERGVFLVGLAVRVAQVFLRRHLIRARLAVADGSLRKRLVLHHGGRPAAGLSDG